MQKYISEFEEGNCVFIDTTNSDNPEDDLLNAIIENKGLSTEEVARLKLEIKDFFTQREEAFENTKGQ